MAVQFGFVQMAGFQGIWQRDGKNESLSLTQDREVLQPHLRRAVKQCKCSKKDGALAMYLKNKFPKRAIFLRTALLFL